MPYSSNLCNGGSATASSSNGGRVASNAFDGSVSTIWQASQTASPQWIKYQFAQPEVVTKLRIRPDYDSISLALLVKNFQLYGSTDDTAWSLVYSGTTPANLDAWSEFIFTNSSSYSYYRLDVIDHWYTPFSGIFTALKELEMMSSIPSMKSISGNYGVRNYALKSVSPAYQVYGSSQKQTIGNYSVYQPISIGVQFNWHIMPPKIEVYDQPNGKLITGLSFGLLAKGSSGTVGSFFIFNNSSAASLLLDATVVYLTAALNSGGYIGGSNEDGQELVSEAWLELKSSGISGIGLNDDAQLSYTAVGGEPSTGGLAIGDIPSGTGRQIWFRINIPANAATNYSLYPVLEADYQPAILSGTAGFGLNFGYSFGG